MKLSLSEFGFLLGYIAIGWMKTAGIGLTIAGVALLSWQQK